MQKFLTLLRITSKLSIVVNSIVENPSKKRVLYNFNNL